MYADRPAAVPVRFEHSEWEAVLVREHFRTRLQHASPAEAEVHVAELRPVCKRHVSASETRIADGEALTRTFPRASHSTAVALRLRRRLVGPADRQRRRSRTLAGPDDIVVGPEREQITAAVTARYALTCLDQPANARERTPEEAKRHSQTGKFVRPIHAVATHIICRSLDPSARNICGSWRSCYPCSPTDSAARSCARRAGATRFAARDSRPSASRRRAWHPD